MAVTVTVAPRVQAAAKIMPPAESGIIGKFIRLVVVMGTNPAGAAGTPKARMRTAAPEHKALAFGGTNDLVISAHNRVFYRLAGPALFLTNLVPVESATH